MGRLRMQQWLMILAVTSLVTACSGPSCLTGPLGSCGGNSTEVEPASSFTLTITGGGTGSGSVTSMPPGIQCDVLDGDVSGDCSAAFDAETIVALNHEVASGSAFSAWSGDCSGDACSVTMSSDRSVMAMFEFVDVVRVRGTVTVKQTWSVDLDAGLANEDATSGGRDLWFEAETATERYLTPRDPAELAFVGKTAPGRAGCAAADFGHDRFPLFGGSGAAGAFLCVLTKEGLLSQVEILSDPTPSPGTIRLRFTTWATPL